MAHGASLNDQHQGVYCPPPLQGVSPAQPMRHRVIRVAWALAVVCGGRLWHLALLFAVLCLRPMTPSAMPRWLDALGGPWPRPAERLGPLRALAPVTECPRDGSYPLGTDTCVMVVPAAHARLLITHAAASEQGEEARQGLPRCTDLGRTVTAAFSASSHSVTAAITAVDPHARCQAAHGPPGTNLGGPRKKSRLSYRRPIPARGADKQAAPLLA